MARGTDSGPPTAFTWPANLSRKLSQIILKVIKPWKDFRTTAGSMDLFSNPLTFDVNVALDFMDGANWTSKPKLTWNLLFKITYLVTFYAKCISKDVSFQLKWTCPYRQYTVHIILLWIVLFKNEACEIQFQISSVRWSINWNFKNSYTFMQTETMSGFTLTVVKCHWTA